jgi:hypothetical protein
MHCSSAISELLRRRCIAADTMLSTIRVNIPKGTNRSKSQHREEVRTNGTIPAMNAWNVVAGPAQLPSLSFWR